MSAPPGPPPALPPPEVLTGIGFNLNAARYYAIACSMTLFYDAMITFGDEVERMWKQKWSAAKVLWFLHRYYNLALWVVVAWGFIYSWSPEQCDIYHLLPFVATIPSHLIIAIILILRTWSLYRQSRVVLGILIAVYLVSLGLQLWPITFAVRVPLPPPFTQCILGATPESGNSAIAIWLGTSVFDAVVFGFTIGRTIYLWKQGMRVPLLELMLRDGVLYFGTIVGVNALMIFTFIFGEGSIKVINASFMHVMTAVIVSRIMLNLKGQSQAQQTIVGPKHMTSFGNSKHAGNWSVEERSFGDARFVPMSTTAKRSSEVGISPNLVRPPPPPIYQNSQGGMQSYSGMGGVNQSVTWQR